MGLNIDFKGIKAAVTVEQVADILGLQIKAAGETYRGKCPICKHDDPRAMVITPAKGVFYCFKCKKGGDYATLVSKAKGIEIRDAFIELAKACGVQESPAPKKEAPAFDAEKYLASLDPAHESITALGITEQTFREWKGGFKRGKLMLAIEASDGIKGFLGIDPATQEMTFPKDIDPRVFIFGAYHLQMGDVYLLKTPLDCLIASENGISNCVSFLTETISTAQWFFFSKFLEDRKLENTVLS